MRVLCRSAAAEADATAAKKSVDSLDTLGLLDVAEGLVKPSTGSGIGAGTDAVAGFFGKSTEGANAIASLKTIAGQLISKMPRMEGLQRSAEHTSELQSLMRISYAVFRWTKKYIASRLTAEAENTLEI